VTLALAERGLRAVLLDIEGTTTPISFVHDVLFSYARAHLREHLEANGPGTTEAARLLQGEHQADVEHGLAPPELGNPPSTDTLAAYLSWLMDRDRKSPALKLLQGHIWERGYREGQLHGQVYPDVPGAIRRWRDAGLVVAIYSSGSELAQRRLFESTGQGDLTPLISAFFDTGVGPKMAPESYTKITDRLALRPSEIVFISDVTKELAAARSAGLAAILSLRPGNPPQADSGEYEQIHSFEGI
jgi:2,3-diketo-5-methylthio-1-phosphopentane phosphatase